MVFKNLCVFVLRTKVDSALEGLNDALAAQGHSEHKILIEGGLQSADCNMVWTWLA